jgi:hypothetical protein
MLEREMFLTLCPQRGIVYEIFNEYWLEIQGCSEDKKWGVQCSLVTYVEWCKQLEGQICWWKIIIFRKWRMRTPSDSPIDTFLWKCVETKNIITFLLLWEYSCSYIISIKRKYVVYWLREIEQQEFKDVLHIKQMAHATVFWWASADYKKRMYPN